MENKVIHGQYSYGNPIIRGNKSKVYTGRFCSISDFAIFDCGFNHNSKAVSTFPFNQVFGIEGGHPFTKGDILIGNDVWIGEGAMIMSGITIGDGAIIGAKSLVTKSVNHYEIVGAVPAKKIKDRFTFLQTNKLLELKWWTWPIEKIKENAHLLMSDNIDELLNKHGL